MASDVSQRAREAARRIDHAAIHSEARQRHIHDATQSGFEHHFATVAAEYAVALVEAEIRAETALPPILIDPTGKGYPTDERPMTVAEFEAVIRADAAAIERERCALVAENYMSSSTISAVGDNIATAIRKGQTP